MTKLSKRVKAAQQLVDKAKTYTLKDAISILRKAPKVKFDETVELAIKLNLDPKEMSVSVRGTVALPHGTGKERKVCVFCEGEDIKKAQNAGADYVGALDLVEKVVGGWCEFDAAIATPNMMKHLGRLGKVLGPRGLMPNPKAGTVTEDVAKAVKEVKAGRIEFKMDKQANVNCPAGKLSFPEDAIYENCTSLIEAVSQAKPQAVRGQFIKSIAVSSSMGPGLRLDLAHWK